MQVEEIGTRMKEVFFDLDKIIVVIAEKMAEQEIKLDSLNHKINKIITEDDSMCSPKEIDIPMSMGIMDEVKNTIVPYEGSVLMSLVQRINAINKLEQKMSSNSTVLSGIIGRINDTF